MCSEHEWLPMSVNLIAVFCCEPPESLPASRQKRRAAHECTQCEQSTVIIGDRVAQEASPVLLVIFPNGPKPASRAALV